MKTTQTQMSHLRGTVLAVDPAKRKLTVSGLILNKDFEIAEDAEIHAANQPAGALSDLKSGDHVDVYYEEAGLHHIAHRVIDAGAHAERRAA